MKQRWFVFAAHAIPVVLTATAHAEQSVQRVQTTGGAQMNRASDAMIAKNGNEISVSLPQVISKGEVIAIRYQVEGSTVSDSFMVTDIVLKNGTCVLQSKHPLKKADVPIDTITARSCRRLE